MAKYNIYGIGAGIVDTEIVVTDKFLKDNGVEKGVMTLVDEERQHELINSITSQTRPVKRSCGGSACNTVVAASKFGSKTFYSAKVAADKDGSFFVKDLKSAGVDFHNVKAEKGITGKCLVMVTPDAERTMNTCLGASLELTSQEVDEKSLANSEWLYMEGYLVSDQNRTNVAIEAMNFAKQNNVKTSMSLSDPFIVKLFSQQIFKPINKLTEKLGISWFNLTKEIATILQDDSFKGKLKDFDIKFINFENLSQGHFLKSALFVDEITTHGFDVFLYFFFVIKFLGISSSIFFQSVNLPKKLFIWFIPSSVVKTGNFGILIL